MGISVVNLTDRILPTEVSLSNAYPNPFNPSTMISYDVPADMNVSLAIYDMRGRLVNELVNDMREQGRYEMTWNADQHASGIYMIKIIDTDVINFTDRWLNSARSADIYKKEFIFSFLHNIFNLRGLNQIIFCIDCTNYNITIMNNIIDSLYVDIIGRNRFC